MSRVDHAISCDRGALDRAAERPPADGTGDASTPAREPLRDEPRRARPASRDDLGRERIADSAPAVGGRPTSAPADQARTSASRSGRARCRMAVATHGVRRRRSTIGARRRVAEGVDDCPRDRSDASDRLRARPRRRRPAVDRGERLERDGAAADRGAYGDGATVTAAIVAERRRPSVAEVAHRRSGASSPPPRRPRRRRPRPARSRPAGRTPSRRPRDRPRRASANGKNASDAHAAPARPRAWTRSPSRRPAARRRRGSSGPSPTPTSRPSRDEHDRVRLHARARRARRAPGRAARRRSGRGEVTPAQVVGSSAAVSGAVYEHGAAGASG